jgi:hypothetical protein
VDASHDSLNDSLARSCAEVRHGVIGESDIRGPYRFLNDDDGMSLSLVFGDGPITSDVRSARFLYTLRKFIWYFHSKNDTWANVINMFYEDEEWTILKSSVEPDISLAKDLVFEQRDREFVIHMNKPWTRHILVNDSYFVFTFNPIHIKK